MLRAIRAQKSCLASARRTTAMAGVLLLTMGSSSSTRAAVMARSWMPRAQGGVEKHRWYFSRHIPLLGKILGRPLPNPCCLMGHRVRHTATPHAPCGRRAPPAAPHPSLKKGFAGGLCEKQVFRENAYTCRVERATSSRPCRRLSSETWAGGPGRRVVRLSAARGSA